MSLRKNLARATPFEMGFTEFDGETWQLIVVLTSDSISNPLGDRSLSVGWSADAMDYEKWLFLHVSLDQNSGSDWSFAFDCNESEVLAFFRQLLREKRLMMAFPDQKAVRLEGAADRLVERLGESLGTYLPGDTVSRELKTKMPRTRNWRRDSLDSSGFEPVVFEISLLDAGIFFV